MASVGLIRAPQALSPIHSLSLHRPHKVAASALRQLHQNVVCFDERDLNKSWAYRSGPLLRDSSRSVTRLSSGRGIRASTETTESASSKGKAKAPDTLPPQQTTAPKGQPLLVMEKKTTKLTVMGVPLTPDVVAIGMVYFVQGVLGLSRLAVTFFLKDELGLDPVESSVLMGITTLPWLVKPLYGFISDGLPLFGYRRRSYLVLCGLLGAFSWGTLALFVSDKYSAVIAILLSSLSVAFSDVVVDSMVVERARGEAQSMAGSLQSLCWGSSAAGGIISAYFSGALVEHYGTRFVFGLTATLPLLTSAVAGLVNEQPTAIKNSPKKNSNNYSETTEKYSENSAENKGSKTGPLDNGDLAVWEQGLIQGAKHQLLILWDAVRKPEIFLPTLFIFFWQASPQSDNAMFYFTTNKLGFSPEFLGRIRLVTSVASLVGVGLYNAVLKEVPLRKVFLWTTLLGTGLGMTQLLLVTGVNRTLGISDQWFALGDNLVLTVLGQISFMPILVLAARICPEGIEATLFATLMSISNGASVLGGVFGAALTKALGVTSQNFDNLALLVLIANGSSLLALPFLRLLPKSIESDKEDEGEDSVIDVEAGSRVDDGPRQGKKKE